MFRCGNDTQKRFDWTVISNISDHVCYTRADPAQLESMMKTAIGPWYHDHTTRGIQQHVFGIIHELFAEGSGTQEPLTRHS